MSTEPTAGYTVAAVNVTARDVVDALTAGHEGVFYREAIARDGLAVVQGGDTGVTSSPWWRPGPRSCGRAAGR